MRIAEVTLRDGKTTRWELRRRSQLERIAWVTLPTRPDQEPPTNILARLDPAEATEFQTWWDRHVDACATQAAARDAEVACGSIRVVRKVAHRLPRTFAMALWNEIRALEAALTATGYPRPTTPAEAPVEDVEPPILAAIAAAGA